MATKEEVARLQRDVALVKQMTKEPGWLILDTQLEGTETQMLRDLRSDTSGRAHSDDWYKGYLACLEMVRSKPEALGGLAEAFRA